MTLSILTHPPVAGFKRFFAQKKLPAARARTPLAGVLGLGSQESLTPDKRDVCLVGRNEATFGKSIVHQAAAFE